MFYVCLLFFLPLLHVFACTPQDSVTRDPSDLLLKKRLLLFLTIITVTTCFIKNMNVNKQEFTHNLAIQRYKAGLNKQKMCFCVLRQKELFTRGSGCAKIKEVPFKSLQRFCLILQRVNGASAEICSYNHSSLCESRAVLSEDAEIICVL